MSQSSIQHDKKKLSCLSKKLDFFQVLSGILLILFIFGHLLLVSSVLISPKLLDFIAWILEEVYLAQLIGPAVFLLIFVHFIVAARKMPFRQGEFIMFCKHAIRFPHWETRAWLIQVITALIVITLAFTHVYEVMTDLPITAAKSAARVQGPGGALFYTVLLFSTWLHVGIGAFRIGVKYGYITSVTRQKFTKYLLIIVAVCIVLGLITELSLSNLITV